MWLSVVTQAVGNLSKMREEECNFPGSWVIKSGCIQIDLVQKLQFVMGFFKGILGNVGTKLISKFYKLITWQCWRMSEMAGLHHQNTGWHFPHFLSFPCGGIPPGPKWRPHPNTAFIPRWMVIGGVKVVTTVTLPFVCVCDPPLNRDVTKTSGIWHPGNEIGRNPTTNILCPGAADEKWPHHIHSKVH